MTYRTVHIDGSGELRSMDLDARQARGAACAECGNTTVASSLRRIGHLVGSGDEIKVHQTCRT